jgi:pimeloyl-ACP methyl ester carboxylesterase
MKVKKIALVLMGILIFSFFILPWLIPVTETSDQPVNPFPESRYISIYGTQLHYRTFQPEHPSPACGKIMLIHGFAGSTFSFRKLYPLLTRLGYTVTAVDLPAYGYSDRKIGHHTLPDPMLCLYLMLHLNQEWQDHTPWTLAGHSMGASVAGEIAGAYPKSCKHLILMDGVPALRPGNAGTGGLLTTALFRRWSNIIGKWMIQKNRIHKLLETAYGQTPSAEEVEGYLTPLKIYQTPEAILKKFRFGERMGFNTIPDSMRVTVVWGAKDTWIPPAVGKNFLEKRPQSQSLWISEAGHCPMETHPDRCMEALKCKD